MLLASYLAWPVRSKTQNTVELSWICVILRSIMLTDANTATTAYAQRPRRARCNMTIQWLVDQPNRILTGPTNLLL